MPAIKLEDVNIPDESDDDGLKIYCTERIGTLMEYEEIFLRLMPDLRKHDRREWPGIVEDRIINLMNVFRPHQ